MKNIIRKYIDAYRGLAKPAWFLAFVMLVNRMGLMVLPFMTLYLTEDKNIPIGKAGLVITIYGIGAITGAFIGGKITDKYGFYYVQLVSLLGGGALFILLGQMTDFTSICVVTLVLSMINEAFRPANSAAIAFYSSGKNRTRSFTLNRLAINLGWAIGGAIGGFAAARSYHLLFWIDGLSSIGAAFLLWLLLKPSAITLNPDKKEETKPLRYKSAYHDKPYLVFLFLNTIFACCFFQLFTTIPVYFKQDLLMSEQQIGMIMALNGLIIALFEMSIIHRLENKGSILTYIMWGMFLTGLSFIILNIVPGMFVLAMIFITVITFGEIIQMPFAATYWVNRSSENNREQYAALFTISWGIAQIIGPGSAAWLAQHNGFHTVWWIAGGASILSILGYRWVQKKSISEEVV